MALSSLFRQQTAKLLRSSPATFNFKIIIQANQSEQRKSLYKTEEAKKIRFYVLHRYFQYIKGYDKYLEKKFPSAMRLYRVFMDGIREFYSDFKQFIAIVRTINTAGKNLDSLLLKEMELYEQMPKDMLRVAPVLLLSALPFANYVIFPLAYLFPRQLLCRHFWNLQQKSEFSVIFLQKRLRHNKPVFRHLQLQLRNLKGHDLHKKWSHIIGLLGSGVQPTVEQILECKHLFAGEPYHLMYLSGNHIRHLLKMHEVRYGWFPRTRLGDRALIVKAMDRAIIKEGGVTSLSFDALKNACLNRGLNPTNMKIEDMVNWLNQWITISKATDTESFSLLLHCPILLGYNQPSNWLLLYSNKAAENMLKH